MYALDHSEQESLEELAQVEEAANIELTEGKHRCILPIIFDFSFNHYFMLSMLVH
jgi:hypothetical protein